MGDKAALDPQRGAQPSWEPQGAARSVAESKDRVNLQPCAQLLPVRVELHLAGGSSNPAPGTGWVKAAPGRGSFPCKEKQEKLLGEVLH